MKVFIFILLNCTVFAGVASSAVPEALSELDNAKFSVWRIANSEISGTGFLIEKNLFVTNEHVVSSLLKTGAIEDMVLSQQENPVTLKIKRLVSVSVLYDFALLETHETVENYLALQENSPESNDPLFIPAYPDGVFKSIRNTGAVIYDNNRVYMVPVNHPDLGGASGSPVLGTRGQVVGITSNQSDNILIAIKPNHLKEFISGNTGLNCLKFSDPGICIKKDIENLKQLAEQGSPYAQHVLSYILTDGRRIDPDPQQAFVWRKKAAEQGHISSQYNLASGYMMEKNGVQPDPMKAVFWVQQAARQGYPKAQHNLAWLYCQGEVVDPDLTKCLMWLETAAKQQYVRSQWNLAFMYYVGSYYVGDVRIERDLEKAFFWYKKAAEQGHVPSQYQLANMYYAGEGTERNPELFAYWLEQAEQARPADSQIHVQTIEN